jgi:glycosyltransferase involved in cell wall biosynthesis
VIPTYNRGKHIIETLDSVFAQTFKSIEVIVVNDGSSDDSADVLRPYSESGQIQYIEQANAGPATSRNRGLAEAKGEFVAFLDDDDLWPNDKLEWQVAVLKSDPDLLAVYGSFTLLGKEHIKWVDFDTSPPGMIREELCRGNYVGSPGVALIRTAAVRTIHGFDVSLKGPEDWDLWIRLSETGQSRFINRAALLYRVHEKSVSGDYWSMYTQSMHVVRKHYGSAGQRAQYRLACDFVKTFVVNGYFETLHKSRRAGSFLQVLRCILMAALIDPIRVLRRLANKLGIGVSPESAQ